LCLYDIKYKPILIKMNRKTCRKIINFSKYCFLKYFGLGWCYPAQSTVESELIQEGTEEDEVEEEEEEEGKGANLRWLRGGAGGGC
jgi:hypothetical protein